MTALTRRVNTLCSVLFSAACLALIGWSLWMRYYRIGVSSYWYDELATLQMAQQPVWDVATLHVLDWLRAPLFPLLLHPWILVFGTSEVPVRLFSFTLSVISVLLFAVLVRSVIQNKLHQLLTVTMFSVWYGTIWISQQANYYVLVLVLTIVALMLWLQVLKRSSRRSFFALSICCVLGVFTSYTFALLCIGFIFLLFIYRRNSNLSLRLAIMICLFFLPYALLFIYRILTGTYHLIGPDTFRNSLWPILAQPAINIAQLFIGTVFQTNQGLLFAFAFLTIWAGYAAHLNRKASAIIGLTIFLLLISFTAPINRVLTNWYYFSFLIPLLILSYGLIEEALSRKYFVRSFVLVGILLWVNAYGVYRGPWPLWEYRELVAEIKAEQISTIILDSCGAKWILDYYFTRLHFSPMVICADQEPIDTRVSSATPTVYLGTWTDDEFWQEISRLTQKYHRRSYSEKTYRNGMGNRWILVRYTTD